MIDDALIECNQVLTDVIESDFEINFDGSTQKLPSFGQSYEVTKLQLFDEDYCRNIFGESIKSKSLRLLNDNNNSSIGGLIAKSNDDLRQEVFVIQLISMFQQYFKEANL